MDKVLFVVSDLHLGGQPGPNGVTGFQMCRASTRGRLARFIDSIEKPTEARDVHLVVAGDIVDFLAEREFAAFTSDVKAARVKFENILAQCEDVFDALARFAARGGKLTLLLGNHDIELSLPPIRDQLIDRLGRRAQFLYDNQAFDLGPVLVEHGNRADPWNIVPHDHLRAVRSQLSRHVQPGEFPEMPGSRLVVGIMNRIKERCSFVDLLKPEGAGVLPLLAAFGEGSIRDAWKFYRYWRQQHAVEFNREGEPIDQTYIAADADDDEQQLYDLAQRILAGGEDPSLTAAQAPGELSRKLLTVALRAWVKTHRRTFDVKVEEPAYLQRARHSAARGFQVVVYGHTHLVKRVPFEGTNGVYLNTGTWADLMRFPDAIWSDDATEADATLKSFLDGLLANKIDHWRKAVPTCARIQLQDDRVVSSDVYFVEDDASLTRVTTEDLRKRLAPEVGHG